jgi:RNA polymerase sigma factor (sigma-70 family)
METLQNAAHALIENHMTIANLIAWDWARRLPRRIDIDELKSAAYMGLVDAATRYDSNYGEFMAFARPRVNGSILDYLRSLGDWGTSSLEFQYSSQGVGRTGDVTPPLKDLIEAPAYAAPDNFDQTIETVGKGLGERAILMLTSYYRDEVPMKEIGKRHGITEGRVSQLFNDFNNRLKETWTESDFREVIAA